MVRWKAAVVLEIPPAARAGIAPASFSVAPAPTTARAKLRSRFHTELREPCATAPLLERVELTPGGHRKHTLTRTSPGGTTRSAAYKSPPKGDAGIDNADGMINDDWALESEAYSRRLDALREVPCKQSDAQRGAKARSKRAAGLLPAPQMKRICETAVARDHVELHCAVAGSLFG